MPRPRRSRKDTRGRRRLRAWFDDAMGWEPSEDDGEDFSVFGGNLVDCLGWDRRRR